MARMLMEFRCVIDRVSVKIKEGRYADRQGMYKANNIPNWRSIWSKSHTVKDKLLFFAF